MLKAIKNKLYSAYRWLITAYIFRFKSKAQYYQIAKDAATKQKIYQFRYQIYHEELSRDVAGEDHKLKIICDDFDASANTLLFYLQEKNAIIATLRVIIWSPGEIPVVVQDSYGLRQYPWLSEYTSCEFGRLMFKEQYRKKILAPEFIAAVTRLVVLQYNVRFILLSCKPHLMSNYFLIGLRPYTQHLITYPDGIEIPLIGVIDGEYIRKINSPTRFLFGNIKSLARPHLNAFLKSVKSPVLWGKEALLVIDDFLLKYKHYLLPLPSKNIFSALIQHGSYVLVVKDPVELIHEGMVDRTLYLILKGKAQVILQNGEMIELGPGQMVGEFSYFLPLGERSAKVIFLGELLVLKETSINYLAKHHQREYVELLNFIIQSIIYKIMYCSRL